MDLFVYGTLRCQALMAAVSGSVIAPGLAAELPGFGVFPVDGDVVPFIAKQPGASADGLIYEGLSAAQMKRLNLYEGGFGYELTDVTVTQDGELRQVHCYLPPENAQPGRGNWSLQQWERDHLAPAILAVEELFAHDPLPGFSQLRAMWPMIEARAWSRHRATGAPTTCRLDADHQDFPVITARPPQGQFFRLQSVDVQHRRFDGHMTPTLTREGFLGIDAAIVLPYDPARDRVLLVEQARVGPRLRNDPNPWMLEPVAGIVDARETPVQAALRECQEEAGLTIEKLESAGSFYVSPGASTDYFYSYVGLCELPGLAPYLGGLPDEAEDLRLHPMSLDDALLLADSGEIATGPALYLLHWLLRHRSRLQAGA